jgi:hypothetical protein
MALNGYGSSWLTVGWTSDRHGNQAGCWASAPFCRLEVHHVSDPNVGHWGSKQDFRQHPGPGTYEYSSLMVGRWNVNTAYWVQKGIFSAWFNNWGVTGIPVAEQIGPTGGSGTLCPTAYCVRFQKFHRGYVWENTSGTISAVYCPDVDLSNAVRVPDISHVQIAYGHDDYNGPWGFWPDGRDDIDNSGTIRIADVTLVVLAYGLDCRAQ